MSAKRQHSLQGEEQETGSLDATANAGQTEGRSLGQSAEPQLPTKASLERSKPQTSVQQKAQMLQTADLRNMIPEPMDYSEVIPTWTHVFSQFYQTKNELDILGVMTEIHSSFVRHHDIMKKVDSKQLDIALNLSPLELGSRASLGLHDLIYQKDIFRMMAVVGTTCLRWEVFRQRQERYMSSLSLQSSAEQTEEDLELASRQSRCSQFFRVVKSKSEVVYG